MNVLDSFLKVSTAGTQYGPTLVEEEQMAPIEQAGDDQAMQEMQSLHEQEQQEVEIGAQEKLDFIMQEAEMSRQALESDHVKAVSEIQTAAQTEIEAAEKTREAKLQANERLAEINRNNALAESSVDQNQQAQSEQAQQESEAEMMQAQQEFEQSMQGFPPTGEDMAEAAPGQLDAQIEEEKQQKAQMDQALQQQQAQVQAMMGMAPQGQMAAPGAEQQTTQMTGPTEAGIEPGQAPPGQEAAGGGQQVAGPVKTSSEPATNKQFVFESRRCFPIMTEKHASESINMAKRIGDRNLYLTVKRAAENNFPDLEKKKDKKVSKEEAGYISMSPLDSNCSKCKEFSHKDRTSSKVAGSISSMGWCKNFSPKAP